MAQSRIWTNYHLPSVFRAGEQPEHRGQKLSFSNGPPAALFMLPPPISQFAQLDPNHLAMSALSVIIFLPLPVAVMSIVPLICSWSTAMISPVPESFAPISRYSLWPWYWSTPASSRCPPIVDIRQSGRFQSVCMRARPFGRKMK